MTTPRHARYVVDTNVLIAASATNTASPLSRDATPDSPALRQLVWQWLDNFQQGTFRLVLDGQGRIEEEYQHKLGFNDFGLQVILHKWSTCAVDQVCLYFDQDGHAELDEPLQSVIHDLADRKMVAAALDAISLYDQCAVAFAGDTDWHGWEADLEAAGIALEPIIEAWSRQKYAEKLNK